MLPRAVFAKRLRGRNEVLNEYLEIFSSVGLLNDLSWLSNPDMALCAHCIVSLTSLQFVTSDNSAMYSGD